MPTLVSHVFGYPSRVMGRFTAMNRGVRHALVEAIIWCAGLVGVALPDPAQPSVIDLCVFKWIGFASCPGCGLGHAMGYLARGEWALALETHWLSPVVMIVLLARISSALRCVRYTPS